jgi:hypothetical protein
MYPGFFLSSYVLGVRWQDGIPLNRELLIEPHLGDLNQAEGTVMTEAGPIPISWQRAGNDVLNFKGRIPAGLTAELSLPAASAKNVTVNGRSVKGRPIGRRIHVTLHPGDFSGICQFNPRSGRAGNSSNAPASAPACLPSSRGWTVLRAPREHQMFVEAEFLKRNWPKIKLA